VKGVRQQEIAAENRADFQREETTWNRWPDRDL